MTSIPEPRTELAPSVQAQRWTTVLDGQRVRELRQERGLSRSELASAAGISLATVSRLERQCVAPCRTRTLARLAEALSERPASLSPCRQTLMRNRDIRPPTARSRGLHPGPGLLLPLMCREI